MPACRTGSLPAFPALLPNLSNVYLQTNNLSGSVPQSWCDQGTNQNFTAHLDVRTPTRCCCLLCSRQAAKLLLCPGCLQPGLQRAAMLRDQQGKLSSRRLRPGTSL